jgi:ribosome-interacting GTPase 1
VRGHCFKSRRLTPWRRAATEFHLGILKAKLAKYRQQLLEPAKGASAGKVRPSVHFEGQRRPP